MKDLKKKTLSGFVYKFAERAGASGISFLIQLLLARLLLPEEYGLIALVTVLITILDTFVTFGFGNALIANKNSDSADFSTCFYFTSVLSLVLYFCVFISAPRIASFYHNSLLTPVIRVMALRIPVAAVNSVQYAYVSKHMAFKNFFYATLIGTVVSGVIAVIMAFMGLGVWALVEQYLVNSIIHTLCLWIIVGWRPTKEFSVVKLKAIYSYGWRILAVGLIDKFYSRLRNLVIGRMYSAADLAFYTRGYSFPSFGMRMVEPTVNGVLFPALSHCQDNQAEMKDMTRKVILASSYIIYPIMIMLIVVAKPLVVILLTDKWLPCVVYLQIGCIANLFRPQQFINTCVIKASGHVDLLLKLDIVKKVIGVIILLVSMQYGIIGVALSLIVFYFVSMVINIAPNRWILGYGYREQFSDVFKNLFLAIIMGIFVYPLKFLNLNICVLLILQLSMGGLIYFGLSWITQNESFIFISRYAKKIKNKL